MTLSCRNGHLSPPRRPGATTGFQTGGLRRSIAEFTPHIKPAGLINRLIGAVTQPGDPVVDPAAGSFVVLQECQKLGRRFIGCDIAHEEATARRALNTVKAAPVVSLAE
jgi:hypothetical protein